MLTSQPPTLMKSWAHMAKVQFFSMKIPVVSHNIFSN